MKSYAYELKLTVRDYELDFQGIVNNAVYMNYLEHTRHEFLKQAGINLPLLHQEGVDPVVTHADIQYKHSLASGDAFTSYLSIQKEGIRFIFYQDIYRDSDNQLMIKAKIESAILQHGRPMRLSIFDELFKDYLSTY
ncbi:MAG: acyl-CoA thioesterase [Bacteroidales bacterium]|jgi:acyl-CoA thioester hydrolase|nr:acyl-CoA thioesterase [Bacteroidales bacterium]